MVDLEWTPKYNMLDGLRDSYDFDFKLKPETGPKSKSDYDFSTDDMVLEDDRIANKLYTGMAPDKM